MERKKTVQKIDRDKAMKARPQVADIAERKPLPDGGERISFFVQPAKWHRILLRLPERIKRDYEFDTFGLDVVNLCDGRTPVQKIINHFTSEHGLDEHEAERAVVTYINTLMRRRILSMVVKG